MSSSIRCGYYYIASTSLEEALKATSIDGDRILLQPANGLYMFNEGWCDLWCIHRRRYQAWHIPSSVWWSVVTWGGLLVVSWLIAFRCHEVIRDSRLSWNANYSHVEVGMENDINKGGGYISCTAGVNNLSMKWWRRSHPVLNEALSLSYHLVIAYVRHRQLLCFGETTWVFPTTFSAVWLRFFYDVRKMVRELTFDSNDGEIILVGARTDVRCSTLEWDLTKITTAYVVLLLRMTSTSMHTYSNYDDVLIIGVH